MPQPNALACPVLRIFPAQGDLQSLDTFRTAPLKRTWDQLQNPLFRARDVGGDGGEWGIRTPDRAFAL
jgi:hypothetical protein